MRHRRDWSSDQPEGEEEEAGAEAEVEEAATKRKRQKKKEHGPEALLRLEIRDLSHPGCRDFLSAVDSSTILQDSVVALRGVLYGEHFASPPTRSVTLVLQPMAGLAYTRQKEIDADHKEIHLSLDYIHGLAAEKRASEIRGVLLHELVHCWQWNGRGTAPAGLIEGIADWVRLKCGLAAPHWRKGSTGKWDAGYEQTAYFLVYLERVRGRGTVSCMNECLRVRTYDEKAFWHDLFGKPVEALWHEYVDSLKEEHAGHDCCRSRG